MCVACAALRTNQRIGSTDRDAQHNISNSEIVDSVGAAISYTTAGEVSPILTLESNRIVGNCRQMYGNFSTCAAAVKVDVQNMQTIHFRVSIFVADAFYWRI